MRALVVAVHGLCGCGSQHGLSSCGTRAWLSRGMWDPPGPEIEPVSPALAGRFLPMGHEESPRDGFYYNIGALKLDLKSILVYVFCMIYWVFTMRKNFDFIKTDDLSLKIAFTIFMPAKEIIFFELCLPFSLLLHSMSLYTRLQLSY